MRISGRKIFALLAATVVPTVTVALHTPSAAATAEPDVGSTRSFVPGTALPSFTDPLDPPSIIGGSTATSADGLAVLYRNGAFTCSGSLIHNRWVLTAKHCFAVGDRLSVRVKSLDRTTGGAMVAVDYAKRNPNGDMALLHLASSANGRPVPLATQDPPTGQRNEIYGWGKFQLTSDSARILRKAVVTVRGTTRTDAGISDAYGGPAILSEEVNGRTCSGDSGGPQFKWYDGGRYQVGVASTYQTFTKDRGDYCDVGRQTYASVAAHRAWIRSYTGF